MSRFKRLLGAKVLIILLISAGLAYVDLNTPLSLGLDLKGGTQLDYKIDMSKVSEADRDQIVEGVQEVIRKRVDSLGVAEPSIYSSSVADEEHIIVELAGIDDIEEAKAIVGKTIQLEFREENEGGAEAENREEAQSAAQAFFDAVSSGTPFEEAVASAEENAGDLVFTSSIDELKKFDEINPSVRDLITDAAVGQIFGPSELNEGFTIGADGQLVEQLGISVVQVTARDSIEEEVTEEEQVTARHILIGHSEADETNNRSKDEALTLANELKGRLDTGEDFAALALEFSDDAGSGSQGGDLGSFGRGRMVAPFEEAAFSQEIGVVGEPIESEFGYHIIQVSEKTQESTSLQTFDRYAVNKATYSLVTDPWKKEAAITGEFFQYADVAFDQTYQPYVNITFKGEGGDLFEELTENNVGKQIAIFVGGDLISAPVVNGPIPGGQAQISGNFSLEEAQALARDLNTGAIPAPIELSGQYTISATLGAEALDLSFKAGLIGLLALAAYMILVYRVPGVIATVALTIYTILLFFFIKVSIPVWASLLLSLAVFVALVHVIIKSKDSGGEKLVSFLLACTVLFFLSFVLMSPVTMTLAGVAGIILSIGMAVDANVLIFERMKEELHEGKTLQNSIKDGFARAWDSIRDSNFSSLITCAILFYFGSSIIRGFALNLALGILVSMFSAITLSYSFLQFTAETSLGKFPRLFAPKAKKKKELNFIGGSKIWASFSGLLLTASIVMIATFGLNLGLDFTGGTLMELQFDQEVESLEVAKSIEEMELDLGAPLVTKTNEGSILVRTKHLSEENHDSILSNLESEYGEFEELRFTTVGPVIGETLKRKAVLALGITLVMIVLYIAFAFRRIPKSVSPWRFGACAIAALVHDIVIVTGVFALLGHLLGVEIDALFITALLTIMGFSVHDTIVVFDRVRENLRYSKGKDSVEESANSALNQTLARSINTSVSTLLTVLSLYIFGADSIEMFVLALIVGILVGTYSSIFVASPLLVWWSKKVS